VYFINEEDSKSVSDWIIKNLDWIKDQPDSTPAGHKGVLHGLFDINQPYMQDILEKVDFPFESMERIDKEMKSFYKIPEDSMFGTLGWMFVYAEEGYTCKWHKDSCDCDEDGMTHIRLNVLISKPEEGGNPLWRDEEGKEWTQEVSKNESWISLSGKYEHSTTTTKGKTPRILLSLGYNVSKKLVE